MKQDSFHRKIKKYKTTFHSIIAERGLFVKGVFLPFTEIRSCSLP